MPGSAMSGVGTWPWHSCEPRGDPRGGTDAAVHPQGMVMSSPIQTEGLFSWVPGTVCVMEGGNVSLQEQGVC